MELATAMDQHFMGEEAKAVYGVLAFLQICSFQPENRAEFVEF